MGDRNNPIKFGPEWLRNMSRERSASRSNSQNASSGPGTSASGASPGGGAAASMASAAPTNTNNSNNGQPKVLLAKQRYGREEMLALYDRNAEAPPELKVIDTLYQPRGKQPVALNNTFEEDRDNLRSAPPIGGMTSGDKFTLGRGAGRGASNDGRGRPRGYYIRQPSMGRGAPWHLGSPRMPVGYSGGLDDESTPVRPWTNTNPNNPTRNSGDQADWTTKMYRTKRQGNNTNWRSPQTRDEGEEWRSSEPGRSRQLEKWDRDWGDRPSGDKPQSWNNRRNWGSDNQNNEENLPEWAAENAECGGTFDSSGAFHGYSNDDSNLPKHQEAAYSLTRSHTHGSFPRPKVVEEGSDEWWASEKAKKLSPKRFDASDLKFKKQPGIGIAESSGSSTNNKANCGTMEDSLEKLSDTGESASGSEPLEANKNKFGKPSAYKSNQKFTESKTFDALMRSDINLEEANDERGNFQSVIINSNNSLRQKHQHLGPTMKEAAGKPIPNMKGAMKNIQSDVDHMTLKSPEDILVDNIFSMTIDGKDMHSTSSSNSFSNSGMSSTLASAASGIPQMSMSNSGLPSHAMNMEMHLNNQNMQGPVIQPVHHSPGMQPVVINAGGMPSGMQAGIHIPGMSVGMQPGMQNSGYPSVPMQNISRMPSGGMQNMPGMPSGGLQNMPGMQVQRAQTPGMQPVLQNVGITNSALNASLGLPIGPNIGQPYQGMPQQHMPNNSPLSSSGIGVMGSSSMQGSGNMPSFPSSGAMPGISNNVGNASLYLGQNSNNTSMSSANDMPMSNHPSQNNVMIQLQGMQGSQGQGPFGNSMYGNNAMPNANLLEQWYYEDPERNIQGPFSSKDMYNWYRAGFFSPSLMVRRACETIMRPLGTYGPVVPFAQMDNMMNSFPMSGGFDHPQGSHENRFPQPNLALDDSLWGQGASSLADPMWMQQSRSRTEVNNLPVFFWDQQAMILFNKDLF